jgi:mediator of RNA polymerase II transcription subunit 18, fungi type
MHELLLMGQVPASRHTQVLSVLTGLTAAQPQRVVEQHVLFKPLRSATSDGPQRGGAQVIAAAKASQTAAGKERFHLRLVKQLKEADFSSVIDEESSKRSANEGWQMLFRDTPEPGRKEASFRMVQQIQIQSEDPMKYMELLGYK